MTQQRYSVDFTDVQSADAETINVVYWYEPDGLGVTGEAYFRADDYCAPIKNGEFWHPYSGLHFKLHPPSQFGKSKEAFLNVLRWTSFGRATPIRCAISN